METLCVLFYCMSEKMKKHNSVVAIGQAKGPGKRGHIVVDTLLPMMFLGLPKLGNICCGHKMFLNTIRNISCVPDTKFVSATNVERAGRQTGKHLCRHNNVSETMYSRFLVVARDLRIRLCTLTIKFAEIHLYIWMEDAMWECCVQKQNPKSCWL